jgi:mutator protein MutT
VRHRCVGAILVEGRSVLLCHRNADRAWFPDVWDIPGGHIEADEDPAEALERELREELGIVVSTVGEPFAVIESESADLSMIVYRIDSWLGSPANSAPDEHDRIEWIDVADTKSLLLADESYNDLFARAVSASTG